MAIAVDNLADAESLTAMEKEKEEEKERSKSLRRSHSKSPVDGENQKGSKVNLQVPLFMYSKQIMRLSSRYHFH